MKRLLLLSLFVGLMADGMFGWGLGIAPGLSLKNALLYLLVLIFGIEIAIAGRLPEVALPKIHLMFCLLIFVALLSWTANSLVGLYVDYSPFAGFISLKGIMLDHYLFFLVFFVGVRTERDVLWLQGWLLILIAAGNIATLMDAYNLPDLSIIETSHDGRVEGPFGEANQYGLFVAMFLPLLMAKAWTERGITRVFLGIGSALSLWVLVLTISRGAFVALIVGSLMSLFFLRHNLQMRYVKRVIAIGLLAIIGIAILLGEEYTGLIMQRFFESTTGSGTYEITSGRSWIWLTSLGIMLSEPWSLLTGYGWDTFSSVMGMAPHNVYLHRFFELGIFGLLFFVGLLAAILVYARRSLSANLAQSPLKPGLLALVFGFSFLLVGISFVDIADPWYFIWAYVGLAMRGGAILLATPAGGTLEAGTQTNDGAVRDSYLHEPHSRPS